MTTQPLTPTDLVQLDNLIRRGANHLTPDERSRLLRHWDQHRADHAQARRTIGALTAKTADYEQVIRSQRAELLAQQADSPS